MSNAVLIVDDDPHLLNGFQRIFRNEPYEIHTAQSAEEGLSLLRGMQTDVVVVDQNMPGLKGLDFLRLARGVAPETVRIMLTGDANLQIAVQAINSGEIYRFFTKPYNQIELGIALRHAIQQKKLQSHSQRVLEIMKMQASYIDHLEEIHPGISHVKRDRQGAILAQDPPLEIDKLIEELEDQIDRVAWKSVKK
ncbi:MAG: response regulator [Bdellovibrionales bacterium]|nr:response regulator [Bdellovibrionales bacterium]